MKTIAAALAVCTLAGCATSQRSEGPTVVRGRAPTNYENTVTSYFDVHVRGPQTDRTLAFGTPESSGCAFRGSGGTYQAWMVPVIYDTKASTVSSKRAVKTSGSGTSAAAARRTASTASTSADGTVTLDEVKISGKGYFFWFTNDTISAVTRRADCP